VEAKESIMHISVISRILVAVMIVWAVVAFIISVAPHAVGW
jgi:hypothetical protein